MNDFFSRSFFSLLRNKLVLKISFSLLSIFHRCQVHVQKKILLSIQNWTECIIFFYFNACRWYYTMILMVNEFKLIFTKLNLSLFSRSNSMTAVHTPCGKITGSSPDSTWDLSGSCRGIPFKPCEHAREWNQNYSANAFVQRITEIEREKTYCLNKGIKVLKKIWIAYLFKKRKMYEKSKIIHVKTRIAESRAKRVIRIRVSNSWMQRIFFLICYLLNYT